ncbi:MAG TPA: class I SAM-dependent methyltransferase [Nitrospira sp.]|jgi:O-methyltransferase|nr:class I SAM-dependent methyltransferase [Nitrospira sp.]HRB18402.1 class I SAM-dependent methyltransferase [Nitrospira sp.]
MAETVQTSGATSLGGLHDVMTQIIRRWAKKAVLEILPDSGWLRSLTYRPMFETWCRCYLGTHPVFSERTEMYNFINAVIISNKPICYLEFGVYKGESIKHFAQLNSDQDSEFIGFDTFTGLPEDWVEFSRKVGAKTFDAGGECPKFDDRRVSFMKGLFQDTLPIFLKEYKSNFQLVIHNDSDLYSATLYVLTRANDIITPGTVIIFDEFYSVMHEHRALQDYCSAYIRNYEVIAATEGYKQIAIRMR